MIHPRAPGLRVAALRALPPLAAAVVVLLFAALKLYGLNYGVGDENMYFYMAARSAEGVVPYRDYAFAHPPLHLLPAVVLFWLVGGFTFAGGKLIPVLATAVAGIFLYRLSRRHGPIQGVLACALFLLSFDVLRISAHFTGANLAVLWIAVALERLSRGSDRAAAVAFALGTLTAVYVAPSGVAAALALLLTDRRRALRFATTGLAVFAAMNLAFLAAFGTTFLDYVYLHHFAVTPPRPSQATAFAGALRLVFFHNAPLLWSALAGVAVLALEFGAAQKTSLPSESRVESKSALGSATAAWHRFWEDRATLLVLLCATLANFVFPTLRPRTMHYYFMPLFACAAPLAAYALASIVRSSLRALRHWDRRALVAAASFLAFLSLGEVLRHEIFRAVFGGGSGDAVSAYEWKGSGIALVDRVVRPLLWRDEEVHGRRYPQLTYYLWHESLWFQSADFLAAEVRRDTGERDTLFGDSTSAPLIALLAGRRLALDEADTNVTGFLSRPARGEKLIQRLEREPPELLVGNTNYGIYTMRFFLRWARANYTAALRWDDPVFGSYLLLRRRSLVPPASPSS